MEDVSTNEPSVSHDSTESRVNINQDGDGNSTEELAFRKRLQQIRKAPVSSKSNAVVPADELSSSSSKGVEISTTNSNSQDLEIEPPKKIPALELNFQEATKRGALTRSKIPETDLPQFIDDNDDKSSASVFSSSSSSSVQACESSSSVSSADVDSKTKIAENLKRRREEAAQKIISPSVPANVEAPIYTKNNKDPEIVKTPISCSEPIYLPLNSVNQYQVKNSPPQLKLNSTTPNSLLKQENSTVTQLCTNPAPLNISTAKEITPKIPLRVNREKVEKVNDDPILTTAKSLYVPALVKTIANVTIADLMGTQWNFFQFHAELELDKLVENKLVKQKDLERIKKFLEPLSLTMWEILFEKLVLPLEKRFEKSICFWGKELDKILEDFSIDSLLQFLPSLPDFPQFPESLLNILQTKINHFINESRLRNRKIQKLENQASACIINEAITYFRQECEFKVGGQHMEEDQLDALLEKNRNQTFKNFDCAIKLTSENSEPEPENIYSYDSSLYKELENQLLFISTEIFKKNEENKSNMEQSIKFEMENSKKIYKTKIQEYAEVQLKLRNYDLVKIKKEFYAIGNNVLKQFADKNKKKKNCPSEIVQRYHSQLVNSMESELVEKIGQLQSDAEEREKKQTAEEEHEDPNNFRIKYDSRRKPQTQAQSDMNQNGSGTFQSASHFNNLNSGHQHQPPVNTNTVDADGMKSLPTATLAFHIGQNKTKMGITDNQGEFRVLVNMENVLYDENSRLVPHMDKDDSSGKFIPLKGLLLKNSVDKQYDIRVKGEKQYFRIETLFSFLLKPLKLKAELEFRKIFNKALIVIPQTFNTVQRQAVADAASLAGFEVVDLINDTTALAFNFMMNYKLPKNQELVSINSFEGFIDTALFSTENGALVCEKKFGDFFFHCKGITKTMIGWVTGGNSYPNPQGPVLSHKAVKAVVEKIVEGLGTDSSTTPCILACINEDRWKFRHDSLDFIPTANNCYALEGASALVSMVNCPSVENAHYRKWQGMNSENMEVHSLKNLLTAPGPPKIQAFQNPEQGENVNPALFSSLKELDIFDKMKIEEEACLQLLKLALNVERILFNSSHPDKDKYKRAVDSYYEKLKEVKHVDLNEIYNWQDESNQIFKNLH